MTKFIATAKWASWQGRLDDTSYVICELSTGHRAKVEAGEFPALAQAIGCQPTPKDICSTLELTKPPLVWNWIKVNHDDYRVTFSSAPSARVRPRRQAR
jgi:hypothetical protein